MFHAITKSNGWSVDTAALQLFAHLDGEAIQVVLLMPDRIRERWKDFVDELSAYYNTPGRMCTAVRGWIRLLLLWSWVLALHGFSDMKEKARDLMVRNKFIASQQSCDLRRHLDSATPETSIADIVDSCRIWESHAETGSHTQVVSRPIIQSADVTHAPSADREFKPVAVLSRKRDAGVE